MGAKEAREIEEEINKYFAKADNRDTLNIIYDDLLMTDYPRETIDKVYDDVYYDFCDRTGDRKTICDCDDCKRNGGLLLSRKVNCRYL